MVQKNRHLWGWIEIGVLVLLVCGFFLAGLAKEFVSAAQAEPLLKDSNHLWLSIQDLTNRKIAAHVPSGFTNRLEFFSCTNLLDFWWVLAATNILTEGTGTVYWTYGMMGETGLVFVTAGNADIDFDGDGIKDAREKFLYHTDPKLSDTDGDGAGSTPKR